MPSLLAGFTDRYLRFIEQHYPVWSTSLGLHSHDDMLGSFTPGALSARRRELGDLLDELEGLPDAGMSAGDLVDRETLRIALRGAIFNQDVLREHERNPCPYLWTVLSGCNGLLLRDFAPLEERARCFAARLRQAPRVLAECRGNVRKPPSAFAQVASRLAAGGLSFLDATVPALSREVPSLEADLAEASAGAREAFDRTAEHFGRVARESDLPFHIGRGSYDWLLREIHLLDIDSQRLLELGRQAVSDAVRGMERAAAEIDPSRTWREIVDELSETHPDAQELRETYAEAMARARDFVRDKRLVTVPDGEELSVVDTPVFLRALLPYAAYGPPGPFERQQEGFFYVTPIEEEAGPEEQEAQLKGHAMDSIRIIAIHEGYPGHHVQLVRANRASSTARTLARSNLFIEGWALYCEEMMLEMGFLHEPSTVLMQRKAALCRAARVVVDVMLQSGDMSLNDAADFMVSEAALTRDKAVAEVRRYAMNPTQPSSYALGKIAITDIRRRYEQRLGRSFELRTFHDTLLDLGSIPPALAERALGLSGNARGQDRTQGWAST